MDSAKNLALYERMARADLLGCAWEQVRRNKGAAGIDGETIADVEAMGETEMLAELRGLLETGRYRPRRLWGGQRSSGSPRRHSRSVHR